MWTRPTGRASKITNSKQVNYFRRLFASGKFGRKLRTDLMICYYCWINDKSNNLLRYSRVLSGKIVLLLKFVRDEPKTCIWNEFIRWWKLNISAGNIGWKIHPGHKKRQMYARHFIVVLVIVLINHFIHLNKIVLYFSMF